MKEPARSDGGGVPSVSAELSAKASAAAEASAKAEPRGKGRTADEVGEGNAKLAGGGTRPPAEGKPDDEAPGVPGFRTWGGVYWFVFACFAAIVLALTVLVRVFS